MLKEYRNASMLYSIITDDQNNITYVFCHSTDFLQNYIRFHKYFYDNVGLLYKSNIHGPHCTQTISLDRLSLENNKLIVFYTNYHIPFNKQLDVEKLPQLLKDATLLLEYN